LCAFAPGSGIEREPLDTSVSFTDGLPQLGAPAWMGAAPGAFPEQLGPRTLALVPS